MKKTIFYSFVLTLFTLGQIYSQATTQQNLNSAIESAEKIKVDVKTARRAVNQLVKELTILGNPNSNLFNNKMIAQINAVQNNADDVDYLVNEAKNVSALPFSSQEINGLTADLVILNDNLMYLNNQIVTALNNNSNNVALNYVPQVRSVLTSQNNKAIEIINKIDAIKLAVKTYNVCIQTVDNQGNPVAASDLFGFYGENLTTNEGFYPTNQEGTCFENLLPGTYRFDSFDGYFSGTGSAQVTLSDSLVNADGVIVVNLVYWSE
ncbi:hypothetical protein [Flavobacterium sp.]|uniref:hypothetical protein n=1 Tax=Flavobacterium sp. TaxID=239 RepID=UPI00286DEFD0|nr:hypothetical protein [Flavobacterium sp.]